MIRPVSLALLLAAAACGYESYEAAAPAYARKVCQWQAACYPMELTTEDGYVESCTEVRTQVPLPEGWCFDGHGMLACLDALDGAIATCESGVIDPSVPYPSECAQLSAPCPASS